MIRRTFLEYSTHSKLALMLSFEDILLVVAVSAQATLLAYLHHPMWKALVYTLPLPFTFAALALGQPIDATNVLGMVLMLGYMHAVRLLHSRMRVPIFLAITTSAISYCLIGWFAAGYVPGSDLAFWLSCAGTLVLASILLKIQRARKEPGHRSPLPVWLKVPMIASVIVILVLIKKDLQGFMTMFPMVGVIAAYEARHSLYTICRQIPVMMFAMVAMMMVCRLFQDGLGLAGSLAIGWLAYLGVLIPITRSRWSFPSRG